MLDFLLRFLPAVELTLLPGYLRPWLKQLPSIYAVVDRLMLLGNFNNTLTSTRVREIIYGTIEAIADGKLSAIEVARIYKLVIAKYDPVKAVEPTRDSNLAEELIPIYTAVRAKVFPSLFE